ncbi:MAG TPA: hypothetical protein VHC94_16030 [Nitrobacter sp.]|nr:hypothetical protein [Nitrobacter sp.]
MTVIVRFRIASILAALAIVFVPAAFAQGSSGGSIGNDEKSISGSSSPRTTEPTHRSNDRARRPARRNAGGGGAGNFDGAWMVYAVGVTCQGSSSNAVVVTSGKIIGQTARGTVSPNGSVHGFSSSNGITITTVGRLSGRHGSGTFRQSDGCTGRWTATKQ